MGHIYRRQFLAAIGALLSARVTIAQSERKPFRIGVLSTVAQGRANFDNFLAAMRELGYDERQNAEYLFRLGESRDDRLAALAADLVARKVSIIVASNNRDVIAAMRATSTIPIVMKNTIAPVETGLVASLAKPTGNVTGTTLQGPETAGKMVQLLREIAPRGARATYIWEPEFPGMELYRRVTEEAGAAIGLTLEGIAVRNIEDLENALKDVSRRRPDVLLVVPTGAIWSNRARVIEFAAKHRLPAVYTAAQPVAEGGLISYTASLEALERRTASIADRILKGAKPSDIPVEQPTKFELVINLRTAKAIGLTLPQSLLGRADRVIE